ncbi:MAG: zinc ribbon domain-containing protein [Lachnospiraceae bacterium]|nr:zinc ribbon domain-containing protein [Lachnospiraceae bacterium]
MKCRRCGNEMPDDSVRCLSCGAGVYEGNNAQSTPYDGSGGYQSYGAAGRGQIVSAAKKRESNGRLVKLILACAVLVVVFSVLWRLGTFDSKDGYYTSDAIRVIWERLMVQDQTMGSYNMDGFDFECSITIEGKNLTYSMAVDYFGEVLAKEEMHGTVRFIGNRGLVSFENANSSEGWDALVYDRRKQTLTVPNVGKEASEMGLTEMVFTKVR